MAANVGNRSCGNGGGVNGEHCGRHFKPADESDVVSETMSANYSSMKLGKRPRRRDVRTLKLARYLTGATQPQVLQPPAFVDYTHGIDDWDVMLNDRLGCCTISAIGHAVQTWTANALGRELTVPDSTILEYYEKWDGYNPAEPATDQGGVELDVLNDWRKGGFDGHSLDAYVAIELGTKSTGLGIRGSGLGSSGSETSDPNPTPPVSHPIALAIWLFGGAYIGVELPIRAQRQDVWDLPASLGPEDEPGSWGGHAIYLVGYDRRDTLQGTGNTETATPASAVPDSGFRISNSEVTQRPVPSAQPPTLTCITWGKPQKMTFAWFEKYCSEAYALVSKDWLRSNGVAPSGFDLAALESDLELVTGEKQTVYSQ
jgi:hypothetical protein